MRSTAGLRDIALDGVSLASNSDFRHCPQGSSLISDSTELFGAASPADRHQQSLSTCWHGATCISDASTSARRLSFSAPAETLKRGTTESTGEWRTIEEPCLAEEACRMDAGPPPPILSLSDLSSPVLSAPESPPGGWRSGREQSLRDSRASRRALRRESGDYKRASDELGKSSKRHGKKKVMAHERPVSGQYQQAPQLLSAAHHPPETALVCGLCGRLIYDRCVLRVGSDFYHSACLVCCDCTRPLENDSSCFIRDGYVFCRRDYALRFGGVCSRCQDPIMPQELAHQANRHAYHLHCFVCYHCHRQFTRGEQVFVDGQGAVFCRSHCYSYISSELLLPPAHVVAGLQHSPTHEEMALGLYMGTRGKHSRSKRVRTSFTEHQLTTLQTSFSDDPNPDSQDLERIANSCGLTKRVVQVWFQNSRARQKRKSVKPDETETASTPPGLVAGSPQRELQATGSTSLSESSLLESGPTQLEQSADDLTTKSLSLTSLGSSGETGIDLCADCGLYSSACTCSSLPTSS